MSNEQREEQQEPDFPRDHYRDLTQAKANGFHVDEAELERWRREEEMIRATCCAPRQLYECGVTARHFTAPVHVVAWRAIGVILETIRDVQLIDGAVLLAWVRRLEPGILPGRRGQSWIDALYSEQPIPFDLAICTVARELQQYWRLCAWSSRTTRLSSRVGVETDYAELQAEFARTGLDISNQALAESPVDPALSAMEWDPEERELKNLVRTYIPQLDAALGGGHAIGDMLAVGGGTNHGKSYFGIDWSVRQAEHGAPCLIYSCEDPQDLYYCRLLSRFTSPRTSPESIRMRRVDPALINAAKKSMKDALGERLHLRCKRKPDISDVCRDIRTYAHVRGIRSVVIDYAQAVRDQEFPNNRVQEMSSVLTKLKRTCDDVEVALVLLSQYARDDYKDGQEPGLNSFKYCGDIENEAEGIICLWRDKMGILHLKIPKSKWTRARKLRYFVSLCDVTGNFGDWEDDLSEEDS